MTDNGTVFTSQDKQKLQQIEILNCNSVYLTHRGTEVFGSTLLLLLNVTLFKKDSWQGMFEFLRASNYII